MRHPENKYCPKNSPWPISERPPGFPLLSKPSKKNPSREIPNAVGTEPVPIYMWESPFGEDDMDYVIIPDTDQ